MRMTPALTLAAIALASLALVPACTKPRPGLPDVLPGWHSPNYEIIMGRLERRAGKDPTEAPTWVLRYGLAAGDPYGGEVALLPPDALTGYSGGEPIEVHGAVEPEFKSATYPGTWFRVSAIRYWKNSETR